MKGSPGADAHDVPGRLSEVDKSNLGRPRPLLPDRNTESVRAGTSGVSLVAGSSSVAPCWDDDAGSRVAIVQGLTLMQTDPSRSADNRRLRGPPAL